MVFKSCNCDLEMCVLLEEECGPALIRLHPKRIHTNTQPTRRDIFRHCRTHRTALCPPPLSSHTHMHPQGKTAVHQDFFFSSDLRVLDMQFLKNRKSATGIKKDKNQSSPFSDPASLFLGQFYSQYWVWHIHKHPHWYWCVSSKAPHQSYQHGYWTVTINATL